MTIVWKSMKTIPKDGEAVIVLNHDLSDVSAVRYGIDPDDKTWHLYTLDFSDCLGDLDLYAGWIDFPQEDDLDLKGK